jgi:outer membrane protein assembly factor BamB
MDLETGALIRTLYPSDDLVRDAALCGDVAVGGANTSDLVAPVTAFHLIEERVLWKRDIIAEATSRAQPYQVTRVAPGEPGIVLVARQDMLFGYSLDQGVFCWQRPVTLSYHLPNAAQGRVYILSVGTGELAHLLCLDVATGSTLYDVPQPLIDPLDHPLRGTLDRDQIAFSTTRGSLLVCRVSDGRPVWSATYPETLRPPVFVDGRVLVSAFDGQVLVFEPPSGGEGRG